MTAVIKTGGKQYSVNKDDIIIVEKLPEEQWKTVTFPYVLMITEGEKTIIGSPYIENAIVTAEIVEQNRAKKIIVFKKKRRQNYRRTAGHRQLQTKLKIIDIAASNNKKVAKKAEAVEEKKLVKKVVKKAEVVEEKKPVKKVAASKKAAVKKTKNVTKTVKKNNKET